MLISRLSLAAIRALLLCVMSIGLLATTPEPAAAQSPAKAVRVTPSTGITDRQVVTVSWSGFAPGQAFVRQCLAGTTSWRDCSERTQVETTTGADGKGSVQVVARSGYIQGVNGAANLPISCEGQGSCEFVVSECGFSLPADRRASAPASFVAPDEEPVEVERPPRKDRELEKAPPAPPSTKPTLHALGASLHHLVFNRWQNSLRAAPYLSNIDYSAASSPTGIDNLLDLPRSYDFTVTGVPLDAGQSARLSAGGREAALAPVTLSGLVLAYWMEPAGIPVTSLRLSPETVAGIFSGKITSLRDPAVTADNRGCAFPAQGVVEDRWHPIFRTDRSYSNLLSSSWLDALGGTNWLDRFGARLGSGLSFPQNAGTGFGALGAQAQANAISTGTDPSSTYYGQKPRIGFIDLTWARFYGLPVVELKTGPGTYVAPTPDSILRGLAAGTLRPDGSFAPNFHPADPTAYPLPSVSYLVAQTKLGPNFSVEKGQVLQGLLDYAISDAGQKDAEAFGAVPLTPELKAVSVKVSGRIPTEVPKKPLTNTSTTTTTTPDESFAAVDASDGAGAASSAPSTTARTVAPGGTTAAGKAAAGKATAGPGGQTRRAPGSRPATAPSPQLAAAEPSPSDPGVQEEIAAPKRVAPISSSFANAGLVPSMPLMAMAGLAVLGLGRLSRRHALSR